MLHAPTGLTSLSMVSVPALKSPRNLAASSKAVSCNRIRMQSQASIYNIHLARQSLPLSLLDRYLNSQPSVVGHFYSGFSDIHLPFVYLPQGILSYTGVRMASSLRIAS